MLISEQSITVSITTLLSNMNFLRTTDVRNKNYIIKHDMSTFTCCCYLPYKENYVMYVRYTA